MTQPLPIPPLTLMDHQQELVEAVTGAVIPSRFVYSDYVGVGKRTAVAAAVNTICSRGNTKCLIVTPTPWLWEEKISDFAGITPTHVNGPQYRRLQAILPKDTNPWSELVCAIATTAFLRIGTRVQEILQLEWDLLVLDEVHIYRHAATKRYEIAKQLWTLGKVNRAIAITPFEEQIPDFFKEEGVTLLTSPGDPGVPGNMDYPVRYEEDIHYNLSGEEANLISFMSEILSRTDINSEDHIGPFIANLWERRWQSSQASAEGFISKVSTDAMSFHIQQKLAYASGVLGELEKILPGEEEMRKDTLGALNSIDTFESDGNMTPNYAAAITFEEAEKLTELVSDIGADNKMESFISLLNERSLGTASTVIVFTDFEQTARYLYTSCKEENFNTALITTRVEREEKNEYIKSALKRPTVLIITSAAAINLDLKFSENVIHFDIPSTVRAMLQRYGVTQRVGSNFEVVNHYRITSEQGQDSERLRDLDIEIGQTDERIESSKGR